MILRLIQLLVAVLMFPIVFLFHMNKYVISFMFGYGKGLILVLRGKYVS